jgi:hypothetical protein
MNSTHPSVESVAHLLGVTVDRVRLELAGALRRSDPDAREVNAVIRGSHVVGRQGQDGEWRVSVEPGREEEALAPPGRVGQ